MEQEKKVRWDKTRMTESNPGTFEMHIRRHAITLRFGKAPPDDVSDPEQSVAGVPSRIVMNPVTAKQLAISTQKVVQEWEDTYGPDFDPVSVPEEPGSVSALHELPQRFGGVREGQKSNLLFQVVKKLGVEAGYERSFKIADAALLQNRFLLGVSKKGDYRIEAETPAPAISTREKERPYSGIVTIDGKVMINRSKRGMLGRKFKDYKMVPGLIT